MGVICVYTCADMHCIIDLDLCLCMTSWSRFVYNRATGSGSVHILTFYLCAYAWQMDLDLDLDLCSLSCNSPLGLYRNLIRGVVFCLQMPTKQWSWSDILSLCLCMADGSGSGSVHNKKVGPICVWKTSENNPINMSSWRVLQGCCNTCWRVAGY